MAFSHLAGVVVQVCDRVIQRCSICGAVLADSKNTAAPLNEDGSIPEFPTWEVGRFVRVTPGNPTSYVLLDVVTNPNGDNKLPPDACFDLID